MREIPQIPEMPEFDWKHFLEGDTWRLFYRLEFKRPAFALWLFVTALFTGGAFANDIFMGTAVICWIFTFLVHLPLLMRKAWSDEQFKIHNDDLDQHFRELKDMQTYLFELRYGLVPPHYIPYAQQLYIRALEQKEGGAKIFIEKDGVQEEWLPDVKGSLQRQH